MATHDYDIANQSGAAFRTDLNNALLAIVSNNSNSSQPATRYAYMWWADTTAGILKIRNSANDAWIDMLNLDGTFVFDLEDGSASAPSLRFADDTNTGIFSSAADTLDITTGGTSRFKVNNNGHVLIGSPSFDKLLSIHAGTNAVFLIEGASDGTSSIFFGHEGDENAGSIIYNHTANDFVITAEDDIRIDCAQVGIGLSNPVAKVHVKQDSTTAYDDTDDDGQRNAASVCIENGNGTTNTYAQIVFDIADSGQAVARITALRTANSSSALTFTTEHSNTKLEKMRIASNGDVGIGEKAPLTKLHVSDVVGGTVDILTLHADSDGGGSNNGIASIKLMGNSSHAAFIKGGHTLSGKTILTFFTDDYGSTYDPLERVRIQSSGEISIGTTSKNLQGGGASDFYVNIQSNTGSNHNGIIVAGVASGHGAFTTKPSADHTYLAGFFMNSSGSEIGNITCISNAVGFNSTSDYRLKENVTSISDGISRLKQLIPRRFNWISDETNTLQDGFLAHEVSSIVPESINGEKDAVATVSDGIRKKGDPIYQSMDYAKITPLLTAALQEAIAKIETLETKVAALESA